MKIYEDTGRHDSDSREDGRVLTCGRDESKDEFPGEGEEVHDVISAARHLLLSLLAILALLLIVICSEKCKARKCQQASVIARRQINFDPQILEAGISRHRFLLHYLNLFQAGQKLCLLGESTGRVLGCWNHRNSWVS